MKNPLLLALGLTLSLTAPLASQTSEHGIYTPLDDFVLLSSGAAEVTLDGSLAIHAPDFQIVVHADSDGVPTGVETDLTVAGGVTLEFEAAADGSFGENLPLGVVPLPPFALGPDLVIAPAVLLECNVSGEAAAGMRASFVQAFEFTVGIDIGPGLQLSSTTPEVLHLSGQPEASGAAEVHVEVTAGILFVVSWKGIPFGGPYAGAAFGADLALDPLGDPWWTLDGHLNPFFGYTVPFPFSQNLPGAVFEIGRADGPLLADPPKTRWSNVLHLDGDESLREVVPQSSGTGFTAVAATHGDLPWIAELDEVGEILDERRGVAQPFGYERPVAVLTRDDGGRILVGNPTGDSGARIDRVDADGNVVWSRTLSHPTDPLIDVEDAVELPGGDFALAGTATTIVPAGSVAWVARFDDDGLQQWGTEVDPGGAATYSEAAALIRCANGDLAIAGVADFEEYDGTDLVLGNGNLWLARLTDGGDLVFATSAGTVQNERSRCLAEGADGRLTVGTEIQDGGSDWAGLYVFEGDGALVRAVAYHGDEVGIVSYDLVDVAPIEGGTLVLGTVGLGTDRDAWLALVADNGGVLWWKTIGGGDDDLALGLAALDDGLIAWGSTESLDALGSGTGIDAWCLRTDVDGMLHFDSGNDFDARNDDVWWSSWSAVTATGLAPQAEPLTLTPVDAPLELADSGVSVTTL